VQVDVILRRVGRTAAVLCLLMSAVAFAITGGRPAAALAVLAGGLLVLVSYRMIVSGTGVLPVAPSASADTGHARGEPAGSDARVPGASSSRRPLLTGANVAGRYALLTVLAYVMIARLRLYPLGLLAGASSVVAAAALEAGRLRKK
jgi:hypothetical protein